MPRVKLDKASLFDPLEIDLGDMTLKSVPRSPVLIEKTEELRRSVESKQIEPLDQIARTLALVFGEDPDRFRVLDIAILNALMSTVNDYLVGKLGNRPLPGAETETLPGHPTPPADGSGASPASPASSPEHSTTQTS